jgi:hypothetical protein
MVTRQETDRKRGGLTEGNVNAMIMVALKQAYMDACSENTGNSCK